MQGVADPADAGRPVIAVDAAQICNLHAEALFASPLQRSQDPTDTQIRQAVDDAVQRWGEAGCAVQVAQEYGEHPDLAVRRMRWCRTAVKAAFQTAAV
jgi:hypothetical protein